MLFLPLILRAYDSSPFEDFIIALWPEYDHDGVLVIYTGNIKKSHLPLPLDLRVPDETSLVLAVGQSDTADNLEPIPLQETKDGKWARTRLVRSTFQIEFYFNPFGDRELREGSLTIQLNQPLASYHLAVQRPLVSERFQVSEPQAETFRDDHGFTYYRVHLDTLPAGQAKTLSFSYVNREGRLSLEKLEETLGIAPGGPGPTDSPSRSPVTRYRLPTIEPLIIVGMLSLVMGYVFLRSNSRKPTTPPAKSKNRFCPHCGSRVSPGDNFCPTCGKKLA